jgi:hypothetical protein
MKIVKISLVIVVIGIISFFVIKSLNGSSEKQIEPPKEKNSVPDIENEINNISRLTVNRFCKQEYNLVKYHIDQKYQSKLLGKNDYENKQSKERLSKDLFFTYIEKFINQAYYVFNNSEWKREDIAFIRNECTILRNSDFMEEGSQVDNKCARIQLILSKYDEINNFVATTRYSSFADTSLQSNFPFSDIKVKITRIDSYKRNNLDNVYVNNCIRLHNELNNNKKNLINSYLTYLETKITRWNGKYKQFQFTSFNEYQNIIYNPLRKELDNFKTNCNNYNYNNNRYVNILNRLNSDRKEAYLNIP